MGSPGRTTLLRALRSRRFAAEPAAVWTRLSAPDDPLAALAAARRASESHALLVPEALLRDRYLARVTRDLAAAPRATLWSAWLAERLDGEAIRLLQENPRSWRASALEPSPFEQAVGAAFGLDDTRVASFIGAFHALPLGERRALHALVPRAVLGGVREAPAPQVTGSPERRRALAAQGLTVLRRLLAELRVGAE